MPELTVPDLPGAYEQHRFLKEKLERTEKERDACLEACKAVDRAASEIIQGSQWKTNRGSGMAGAAATLRDLVTSAIALCEGAST